MITYSTDLQQRRYSVYFGQKYQFYADQTKTPFSMTSEYFYNSDTTFNTNKFPSLSIGFKYYYQVFELKMAPSKIYMNKNYKGS